MMPVFDLHDAGHRDDHVEIGMARQHVLGGRVHAHCVGGVDLHGVDVRMRGGDLLEQFGAAASDDDGVTFVAQS